MLVNAEHYSLLLNNATTSTGSIEHWQQKLISLKTGRRGWELRWHRSDPLLRGTACYAEHARSRSSSAPPRRRPRRCGGGRRSSSAPWTRRRPTTPDNLTGPCTRGPRSGPRGPPGPTKLDPCTWSMRTAQQTTWPWLFLLYSQQQGPRIRNLSL